MASPDEKKILKIIEEYADKNGDCRDGRIMREMGLSRDYMRVILQSMGMRDLIDYYINPRRCRIAHKGWQALGKPGMSAEHAAIEIWVEDFNKRWKKEIEEEDRRKEEEKKGAEKKTDTGWRSEWR